MKRIYCIHITISLCCVFSVMKSPAQQKTDSLARILEKTKADTARVLILGDLAWEYGFSNPDTAISICKKANELAARLKWLYGMSVTLHDLTWYHYLLGDFETALDYCTKNNRVIKKLSVSTDTWQRSKMLLLKSNMESDYAAIYMAQGNPATALEKYFSVLQLFERMKSKENIAITLLNLGSTYSALDNVDQAELYYRKTLSAAEKLNDKGLMASAEGGLGGVAMERRQFQKAIDCFMRAYQLLESLGEMNAAAINCGNVANAYLESGQPVKTIEFAQKALDMLTRMGDKKNMATSYNFLGAAYTRIGKFKEAEKTLMRGHALTDSIHAMHALEVSELYLSELYDTLGKPALFLKHHKRYVFLRDSLENSDNARKAVQAEMLYEFEKQQAADRIKTTEARKRDELKRGQELAVQRIYIYIGTGGSMLLLGITLLSLRAYRQKRKDNKVIAEQKALVEEKQKEIIDSIHYAKRIQQALLPSEKYIARHVRKYEPK